jgi:hypothetical protein
MQLSDCSPRPGFAILTLRPRNDRISRFTVAVRPVAALMALGARMSGPQPS